MNITIATPGSTCTKEELVDRSSTTQPCGLPAQYNVNGKPRCSAHMPKNFSKPKTKKGQMPKQRRGSGLGEATDRAAVS